MGGRGSTRRLARGKSNRQRRLRRRRTRQWGPGRDSNVRQSTNELQVRLIQGRVGGSAVWEEGSDCARVEVQEGHLGRGRRA